MGCLRSCVVVVVAPSSALYRSVEETLGAPTISGLPHVDRRLRWLPGEDLFVLGANAGLQLGPGCGNLVGAMRGARVVSNELHGLMWRHPNGRKARPARAIFSHKYASLLDGTKDELDYLVDKFHLSPKEVLALMKANSHRKR